MRSLKYLAAALPAINSAYAGAGYGGDDTVIVTATRYVTVCPVEFWTTCEAPAPSHPSTRSGGPGASTTPTTSWSATSTPWYGGNSTIITTTGSNGQPTTITVPGNGTTSTTTSATTTSGNSTCSATQTVTSFDQGTFFGPQCNTPSDRQSWCNGKSVDSDIDFTFTTGHTVTYNLEIEDAMIDADGTGAIAGFTINGQTPGQPIIANWGDTVQITVTNKMSGNATTIHWHGILQYGTNDQDGVPGVTECGIAPGSSRTYTWVATEYGTGWYHSHLLSQYGGGIRGPIIIHGPATADYDYDLGSVMVDEKFTNSIFNLAKYYTTARGTLTPPNYLLNGKNTNLNATTGESARWVFKAGKKHMFRFINSAVQTAFVMHIDNHVMTVVSADFTPIVPYQTENLYIHSGQRYNVIVEADQAVASYYLRAIAQKGCGAAITNDGNGIANGIITYEGSCFDVPGPSNFTLNTAGVCIDEPLASLVPHIAKDAGSSSAFAQTVEVLPAGNVDSISYSAGGPQINTWRLGAAQNFTGTASGHGTASVNVTFDQPTLELLNTVGQPGSSIYSNAVVLNGTDVWVYWVIQNGFITSHPMHLHGHSFSVLGQNEGKVFTSADVQNLNFVNPIRRDTVLLFGAGAPTAPVPGYTVIGFQTDNPGAWLMHCHIIWHADGGMGMQFIERPSDISSYSSSSAFQNECSAYDAWQNADPSARIKSPWESGIKVRHLEEHKFLGYSHNHAVRHE